jgi:prephenate dehydrogenase
MNNMSLGIIGLGLMGGSLALSAKKIPFISTILGNDHNKTHQKEALELGLVDKFVDFNDIKKCDIIILAVPVNGVLSILSKLDGIKKSTTVIDLGSTKEQIVKAVDLKFRQNFVAAHPMTGTENFGPSAAIENLYKDKVVVLCDLQDSGDYQQEVAVRLFSALHMKLHYMHAHEHDRHAAFISHMPHVISYSIANTVLSQEGKNEILTLAAGGFRSMSRLAKSSPNMWEDIFRQNSKNLIEAIELFENELSEFKRAIKNSDFEHVHKKMKDANKLQEIFS